MTDITNEPQQEQPHVKRPVPNVRRHIYLKLFEFVVILTLLGLAFYAQHKLKTEAAFHKEQQAELTQLKQSQQQNAEAVHQLKQTITALRATVQNSIQHQNAKTGYWQLLQARYYLKLAAIDVHWNDQPQSTTALLQQADLALRDLHDPRIIGVRQAIAQEIALTSQRQSLDITGLLSQLDGIQNNLDNLVPKQFMPSLAPTAKSNPQQPFSLKNWRAHLHAIMHQLKQLVVIQHHDKAIEPVLTPAYESMLRENIRLNLQTAQWALLRRNQALFQLGLKQARLNIKRGFNLDKSETKQILEQLNDLTTINLIPQPSPHQALNLLNSLITSEKNAPAQATNSGVPNQ